MKKDTNSRRSVSTVSHRMIASEAAHQPQEVTISRRVDIPDKRRLQRYQLVPDLGPRILFFSGGSALRDVSRKLLEYTYNSIHLITPFDSGGSSARIRDAFGMLSVGDLRNRLMSLADPRLSGNQDIYRLFAHRFPTDASPIELRQELQKMIAGQHPLVSVVIDPMRKVIRNHLKFFGSHMPESFDLRGASIGNLILTGGYLNQEESIDTVIFMFSRLVEVRGTVRPIVNSNLHLAADLADGTTVIGQHLITGKEETPLQSPIKHLWLSEQKETPTPAKVEIRNKVRDLIDQAELIVYPFGSFYSSLIATLLPSGVGRAVSETNAMKVYIPNPVGDSEMTGLSVTSSVEQLLAYLHADLPSLTSNHRLLNFVIVDTANAQYQGPIDVPYLRTLGMEVIDTNLVSSESAPYFDPQLIAQLLISLT